MDEFATVSGLWK